MLHGIYKNFLNNWFPKKYDEAGDSSLYLLVEQYGDIKKNRMYN